MLFSGKNKKGAVVYIFLILPNYNGGIFYEKIYKFSINYFICFGYCWL